jgi:hypothetical protein
VTGIDVKTSRLDTVLLAGLLCIGSIATLVSSTDDTPSLEPISGPRDRSLTQAEQAYLDFVLPRLDLLIEEGRAVSSLVDQHSRNVVALRRHGNRITVLTTEIIEWDRDHVVPSRFLASHTVLVAAADELHTLIAEAQDALVRFDFSGVVDLIPRFDSALGTIQTARHALPLPAGFPP